MSPALATLAIVAASTAIISAYCLLWLIKNPPDRYWTAQTYRPNTHCGSFEELWEQYMLALSGAAFGVLVSIGLLIFAIL